MIHPPIVWHFYSVSDSDRPKHISTPNKKSSPVAVGHDTAKAIQQNECGRSVNELRRKRASWAGPPACAPLPQASRSPRLMSRHDLKQRPDHNSKTSEHTADVLGYISSSLSARQPLPPIQTPPSEAPPISRPPRVTHRHQRALHTPRPANPQRRLSLVCTVTPASRTPSQSCLLCLPRTCHYSAHKPLLPSLDAIHLQIGNSSPNASMRRTMYTAIYVYLHPVDQATRNSHDSFLNTHFPGALSSAMRRIPRVVHSQTTPPISERE